jgi:hypothetical protein
MGAPQCRIDADEPNYPYDRQTFDLIAQLADQIRHCSAVHCVPPVAVAGSIADEYNVQRGLRRLWDWFQDRVVLQHMPAAWIARDFEIGFKSRLFNVTRNDIGRANINIATAREMYLKYRNAFPKELGDWSELVDYILSDHGCVVVATLVISQGQQDLARWLVGRPLEVQEALLVTYFKQGPSYIDRFIARLASHPSAVLEPGEGCRVFHQRAAFLTALRLRSA